MKHFFLSLVLAVAASALATPSLTHAAGLETKQFLRASDGTVYWLGTDERRYVFPDGATLQSWLGGTPGMLNEKADEILEPHPIGGPMTIRPGTRLVRFETDPTTYVVTRGAKLRAVTDQLAAAYYGADWAQKIDVLSVALHANYRMGEPIVNVSDFDRVVEMGNTTTPEADIAAKRENGLLPKSTAPLKAEVKFTADKTVIHPPEEPTVIKFMVTVSKPNTAIANLRTDIFREGGEWQKTCRGIDLCPLVIDYKNIPVRIEDRVYAIVSNEKMETLPRIYSPIVTIAPIMSTP